MSRTPFKSLEEAVDYLYSEDIEADIVALPPEVDDLTDEEEVDDRNLDVPEVTDIAGHLEVETRGDNYQEFDSEDDIPLISLIPSTSASSSTQTSGRCAKKRKLFQRWRKTTPHYKHGQMGHKWEENLGNMKKSVEVLSPVQVFEQIFDSSVYDLIIQETNRYANAEKNKHGYSASIDDIKIFIGFLIFTGYHRLPSERDYWSEDEDLRVDLVRNAMSRNAYLELKSVIHFQDNTTAAQHKDDKCFKIRPLVEIVNANFRKWGICHKNLSIDEMIVRYYGHHSLKQFIRAKPIRFGYKLWAMCGEDGYCYNFSLYCGKESGQNLEESLGTRVVTKMLSVVENPESHVIYFNNFFSSQALYLKLTEMGFRATGTIRENRTHNCLIKSAKEMQKLQRGSYDYQFDEENEICIVKWNDNKCVSVATNFDTIEPLATVQRWSREKKRGLVYNNPISSIIIISTWAG